MRRIPLALMNLKIPCSNGVHTHLKKAISK
jgi:hypothetical protein